MVLRLPQDVPRAHNDLPGARIARWNQGRTNAMLGVRHRHARARSNESHYGTWPPGRTLRLAVTRQFLVAADRK